MLQIQSLMVVVRTEGIADTQLRYMFPTDRRGLLGPSISLIWLLIAPNITSPSILFRSELNRARSEGAAT
jgi:hypothetical protein